MIPIISLSVYPRCKKATIYSNALAGNKGSGIGGEKQRGASQFRTFAEALHRSAHQQFASAIGAVKKSGVQLGAENAGRNGIHVHAFLRPFDGQAASEAEDAGFGRGISGHFKKADIGIQGGDIYDAAMS